MKQKNLRRIVAGASVMTMAAGLAAAVGMSTATAVGPNDPVTWSDGDSNYKRAVSDNNPAIGETITMTTNFYRSGGTVEYVQEVKDLRNPCLTFVSANPSNGLEQDHGVAFSKVKGSWPVYPNISPKTQDFAFTYKVSETCPIGVPLNSSMHYSGSKGPGTYNDKGPIVTVKKATSTTDLAVPGTIRAASPTQLTATVGPEAATGTVEFFNGTTSLGAPVPVSDHKATFDWTPAQDQGGQNYSVTAKYSGDTNREPSTSAATAGTIAVNIVAPPAPISLTASANPAVVGTPVTISGRAEARSTVTITAGAQSCEIPASDNGDFFCTFTPEQEGNLVITAIATNSAGPSSASAPLTITVAPAVVIPAAPTLTLDREPAVVGELVTATVKTAADNLVVINVAGSPIHTGQADVNGIVTATFTAAAVGDLEITATAGNSAGVSPAARKLLSVSEAAMVPAAPTALAVNPNPAVTGEKATISGKAEANSNVRVTASDSFCNALVNASGDFSCDITLTASGPVNVTATNAVGTSPPATLQVTVKDREVAPTAPQVTLSAAAVKVGETVTATIKTAPNTKLTVTINSGTAHETRADGNGNLAYPFAPTEAGTTTISVIASNGAGTSPATAKTVQVTALPQGEAAVSVNPGAPVAGQPVDVTVSGADANTPVVIAAGDTQICAVHTDVNGSAHCQWRPTAGTYTLTITTTVDGAEKVITKPVTVTEPATDPGPGGENPGGENPGGENPGGEGGSGSLGSLGSLSSIFGSLGG